jgi:hypothetical protein
LRDVLVDPAVTEFYDNLQMPDPAEICAMLTTEA